MAVPAYTEDLTDINLAEDATGWLAYGGGGAGISAGPDLSMQGTNCIDKQITAADKGIAFNNGTGITLGTGNHVFVWHFTGTPGVTDLEANKGVSILIGTSANNWCQYHVGGIDQFGAGGRVAKCFPIDYTVRTSSLSSRPYRTVTGSPGVNPQVFGGGLVTTAAVKGINLGIDAIRYGSGAYLTAGELISAGDGTDNPCTFAGFNTQNDDVTNRWGIFTLLGGTYELQGRFVIGQNNSKTPTLCRFEDSNVNIVIVDTWHAASDFTQIIIDHASTVCNWTNISITSLGTINPGAVFVASNNPEFNIIGGVWTDFGTTTFRSNTTVTALTWRNCNQIVQNGSTLTSCFVVGTSDAATALLSDNPSLITYTDFTSDGSGHAVQCNTTGTYSWNNNTDTGYTGTRGSNPTSSSGSADAMFYNNSGGLITLNVSGGSAGGPSVRNGAGATTVVNNNVSVTFTGMRDNTEVRVYKTSDNSIIDGIENATAGTADNRSFTWSAAAALDVYYKIFNIEYEEIHVKGFIVPTTATSIPIQQRFDRNNFNPL